MNIRGISPLIATVLIIGFTVALAAIIITWGGRFVSSTQGDVDRQTKIGLTCSKLDFKITDVECDTGANPGINTVSVLNEVDETIAGFWVRVTNADPGIEVDKSVMTTTTLTRFAAANDVDISTSIVGDNTNPQKLELIALVDIDGIPEVCSAVIESRANPCNLNPAP